MPELSCIIITLNEEVFLPKILKSLRDQTFKDFEIIVSDANSKDKTREIAIANGCKLTDGGIWSVGRNNGAKIAVGKYLLFLDADCELPKNFLEINLREFKRSGVGTGTTGVNPISDRFFDLVFFKLYDYFSKVMQYFSPHCCGASIFATKEVFDKIGGFDEGICFAENHEFTKRAKRYGFKILPIPIYTSVRRLDKIGRMKFVAQYIYTGLYRIFYKEIRDDVIKYEKDL